jgi:hypothetical protein
MRYSFMAALFVFVLSLSASPAMAMRTASDDDLRDRTGMWFERCKNGALCAAAPVDNCLAQDPFCSPDPCKANHTVATNRICGWGLFNCATAAATCETWTPGTCKKFGAGPCACNPHPGAGMVTVGGATTC